jgi:hypothetical protein
MAGDAQNTHMFAIGMQVAGQNAGLSDASSTTAPAPSPNNTQVVRSLKSRMREKIFGSHHQRTWPPRSGSWHRPPSMRVHKTAAHGLHVKRRAAVGAQLVLQNAGGGREHHVRCGRGHNDQIHVLGVATGRLQCILGSFEPRSLLNTPSSAKWRARMPVRSTIHSSEVSTPLARQLRDQIGIGEPARGQIAASTSNSRISFHGGNDVTRVPAIARSQNSPKAALRAQCEPGHGQASCFGLHHTPASARSQNPSHRPNRGS